MADLLCPNCGMPNPDDQNVCSFCRQPLQSATDGQLIRPGDVPSKKTTAELEPILPGWLREARENARRADQEAAVEQAQAESAQPPPAAPDWLAGLEAASRQEEQEELPEWMRGSSGAPPQWKQPKIEDTFPRRQEIRWEEAPAQAEPDALPPLAAAPERKDSGLPAWMNDAEKDSTQEKGDISDWLAQKADAPADASVFPFTEDSFKPTTGELAGWLDRAFSENEAVASAPSEPPAGKAPPAPSAEALPAWLSNLPSEAAQEPVPESPTPKKETIPAQAEPAADTGVDFNLPDWMRPPAEERGTSQPDWTATFHSPDNTDTLPAEERGASQPDWMAAFPSPDKTDTPPASPPPAASTPAFIPGAEPFDHGQADELFSIEMPEWLSSIGPSAPKPAPAAPTEPPRESISPAELPSWVQAMRPVESAMPGLEVAVALSNEPLENQGPLAGLRGVLQPVPELAPAGKAKSHSFRLLTTEDQQANASLLEQMMAAETQARPMAASPILTSQRVVRWVVAVIMLALIAFVLLTGIQTVPLPAALPQESANIVPMLESLPVEAPALLIFDYEPALAGELETSAAPFVDRLIGYRHPRLTLLSTSPTGAALAERFLSSTQSQHNYVSGQNYINLGYLPGGPTGILSFAMNPRAAIAAGDSDWDSVAVQGVNRLSDYAVIVLLTDQADNARPWIEQTIDQRGGRPLVVVSSAQAAPMIQPYLSSGQVNGLVNGLYGGAAFGQATGYSTVIRRYWDAYNLGILFAAALIVIGGLWNFFAGVISRRQGLENI